MKIEVLSKRHSGNAPCDGCDRCMSANGAIHSRRPKLPSSWPSSGENSPNPSRIEPLNRGRSSASVRSRRGNTFSLSPGERAGVRAGFPSSTIPRFMERVATGQVKVGSQNPAAGHLSTREPHRLLGCDLDRINRMGTRTRRRGGAEAERRGRFYHSAISASPREKEPREKDIDPGGWSANIRQKQFPSR
jgi:hypothetical protein